MRCPNYIFFVISLLCCSQIGSASSSLELVETVYERLKTAKGDFSQHLPVLQLSDRVYNIAAYQQADNQLIIEERAIEICRSFGAQQEAALAFIIGHELTHFYQEHTGGFAFMMPADAFAQKVAEEREADLYGSMLAYLADYDVLPILPDLLQQLYAGYQLDANKMPDYPALEERMRIAEEMQKELKHLIETYEIGLYLAALGEYTAASDCFRVVGEVVQSKAILHNQAVAMLSAAVQIQEYGKPQWAYPLQLDSKNPLRIPEEVRKEILLKKAEKLLQQIRAMDANYAAASLHLAMIYSLRNEVAQSESYLQKVGVNNLREEVKLMEAILSVQSGEMDIAERNFYYLLQNSTPSIAALAQRNLFILQQKPTPSPIREIKRSTPGQIDDVNLNFLPNMNAPDKTISLSDDVFSPRNLTIKYLPQSTLALLKMANRTIAIQRIQSPPSTRISQQIKNDDMVENNIHQVNFANQRYLSIFYETMCIFQLDNQNRTREWAMFGIY